MKLWTQIKEKLKVLLIFVHAKSVQVWWNIPEMCFVRLVQKEPETNQQKKSCLNNAGKLKEGIFK